MTRTLLLLPLLFGTPAIAQIAFGGQPLGPKDPNAGSIAVLEMPAVDAAALLLEDLQRGADGVKAPYRFGFNHATDITLQNSGGWITLPNGDRVWRVGIHCPGAYSINFEFNTYVVPPGGRVFVWNENGDQLGAFTAESNPGRTELGVTQLPGDRITIEYHEPAAATGQGDLRIGQVTHAYRDVFARAKGLNDSGPCNNNVICPEGDDWRDQIASVAMITVGGSGICTGQLLNNCNNDGTPYFLTANHCTSGSNVGTWVFRFNWESPTCTPTTNGPTTQTVSGSTLLTSSAGSDVALLELNATPPASYNVYYSGWDASGDTPSSQTCIHHPSGDIKKISFDNNSAGQGNFGGAQCWHIFAWDDGTTEPGSSGAGLWDQDHRIIGQLFGGTASCSNNVDDFFGRFDVSFSLLDNWLGSCGPTLDGYDPNFTPVALDAAVQSITGVDNSYCNVNSIAPSVVIKNTGLTTLTSLNLNFNINGGPTTVQGWSGSLATGATATVSLGSIATGNGSQTLTVFCSDPNGGLDGNTTNDTKVRTFEVTNPGQTITLSITVDDYPEETTWELANSGGTVIASGGPYGGATSGSTIDEPLCLGDGCYDLTVYDAYGDGICCDFGNGNFEVTGQFGTSYVQNNGQFTDEVVENFCVTNTGIPAHGTGPVVQLIPNPAGDQVTVVAPERAVLTLLDATGRAVFTGIMAAGSRQVDLRTLPDGIYTVEVTSDRSRASERLVVRH